MNECEKRELSEITTLRLNIIELECNYGMKYMCKIGGREEESTENMLKCIIEKKNKRRYECNNRKQRI